MSVFNIFQKVKEAKHSKIQKEQFDLKKEPNRNSRNEIYRTIG